MSVGLDCGTSFYIAAREKKIKKQRNAFLTVEGETSQVKRMLARQKIPYVEKSGKVHIVYLNQIQAQMLMLLKQEQNYLQIKNTI